MLVDYMTVQLGEKISLLSFCPVSYDQTGICTFSAVRADSNFRCENRAILVKLEYFHCVNQAQELSVQQPSFRHKVKHALLYLDYFYLHYSQ